MGIGSNNNRRVLPYRKKSVHAKKFRELFRINRVTVRYKVFYFFQQLAAASILTFFSVLFRHLGMSPTQSGMLIALRPLIRVVAAPIWGIIADKTGKYKLILVLNMACSVVVYFSMTGVLCVREYDTAYVAPNVTQYKASNTTTKRDMLATVANLPRVKNTQLSLSHKPLLSNAEMFSILLMTILLGDFFYAPILPVMDGTVTYWEGSHNFGKQRMFDALGFALGATFSGLAMDKTSGIDYFNIGNHSNLSWTPNYMTSFFMYLAFGIVMTTSTAVMKFDVIKQESSEFPWRQLKNLLIKPSVVGFLVIAVILGAINSAATWYVYWFVQDLGGTQINVGLTETVMSLSQTVFYHFGNRLERRIGLCGFISVICVVYATQLVTYSFLWHPLQVLFVEVLHGFNFSALQVMCTTYASEAAPKGLTTTLQSLVYAAHFGLGWALGAFLGGHFYGEFGARVLFRGLAVVSALTLILVAILHTLMSANKGKGAEEVYITEHIETVEYELIQSGFNYEGSEKQSVLEESWSKSRLIDF